MNYNLTNIYYYYLCNFIFKKDLSIYAGKDTFNLLYNNIYHNFIRINLIRIKQVNSILQKRIKKYLIQLNKLFQKLNLCVDFGEKKLEDIKLRSILFYRKLINTSINQLYKDVLLLHKQFKLYFMFKKLSKFVYKIFRLFSNIGLISRYKQNNLFYTLLYAGLQHSYLNNHFYFYSDKLLYQYNNLLLDTRLVIPFNVETNMEKEETDDIIEGSNFINYLTNKFNKSGLCLNLLFRSSKSNTRVTIVLNGKMFCDISCGAFGYKKASRSSYLAANQLAYATSKIIQKIFYKFISKKFLNNNLAFSKKLTTLGENEFNPKIIEHIDKCNYANNYEDVNNFTELVDEFYIDKYINILQPQLAKLTCGSDLKKYLINCLIKENSSNRNNFSSSILNLFEKHKSDNMFTKDVNKMKVFILEYLANLANDYKCLSFKRVYHSRNKVLFKPETSIYDNVVPDFKICLDYTGFGLGRKAAFKSISSSIRSLNVHLKELYLRENNRKLNSLMRKISFLQKKKKLSKRRIVDIQNNSNITDSSSSDSSSDAFSSDNVYSDEVSSEVSSEDTSEDTSYDVSSPNIPSYNDMGTQYYNNFKKTLLVPFKNHMMHLSNILHIIKNSKHINFLKCYMYELVSKCIVFKYISTVFVYHFFDWLKSSLKFYNLNFYNYIINKDVVQSIKDNQKGDFKYLNFIQSVLNILSNLYFCNMLFKFISIKKISDVFISGILNYFIYLFSNLMFLFKFLFISSTLNCKNVPIQNINNKILLFIFCRNYLNIFLSKGIQHTLLTAKLSSLYSNLNKLIIFYLERVNQLHTIISNNIYLFSKSLNRLLYKKNFSDSLDTNLPNYDLTELPYNVENIINMLPKNASNPHNGCRPRRLRRK